MPKYPVLKELKHYCLHIPFIPWTLPLLHGPQKLLLAMVHDKDVDIKKIKVTEENIPIEIYRPKGVEGDLPCIYYLHGGGFGLDAAPHHKIMAIELAKQGYQVIFPYYRLLPKYKYPTARLDVLHCYQYLLSHQEELKIQQNQVIVMGDSAGGTLSIYLCYDCIKYNILSPKGQVLIYPATDCGSSTPSMVKYTNTPLWNSKNNKRMWKVLIEEGQEVEASPLRSPIPDSLPPIYIEVAEFDSLRDEALLYIDRLIQKGYSVEFHDIKGTMHGFDIAVNKPVVQECKKMRLNAIKKFFEE